MDSLNKLGALVGRILMGLIFVLPGFMKLTHLARTVAMMEKMAGMSTMVYPQALAAAVIELVGGLLLMMGFRARAVALILFLYLIPVTILFHIIPGGQMNQINTMKNLAIMGGLLIVATQGPGGFSMDNP